MILLKHPTPATSLLSFTISVHVLHQFRFHVLIIWPHTTSIEYTNNIPTPGESHLILICINWVPGDPRPIFLVTSFNRKVPESSDSMYSSIFMLENLWYHHFTRSVPNSQEIVNFIPNMGPGETKLNWSKIHNFLWIRSTLGKILISYDF